MPNLLQRILYGTPPVPMASPTDCYHLVDSQLTQLETGLLFMSAHWRSRMQGGTTTTPRDVYLRHEWTLMYQECMTLLNVLETLHGEHGTLNLCKPEAT